MRVISLYTVLRNIFKNKIRLLICILMAMVLSAVIGNKAQKKLDTSYEVAIQQYELAVEKYNRSLEKYDNSIATAKSNCEVVQKEYDGQKEYCDNSIYMQLDGNNFYLAQVQYSVEYTGEDEGNVINILKAYVDSNSFINDISTELVDVKEAYIREIISTSVVNNELLVTVMHYDAEIAQSIIASICEVLNNKLSDIENSQPEFVYTTTDATVAKKADLSVVNTQNSAMNNLRSYAQNVTDAKNTIINNENEKTKYLENETITEVSSVEISDRIVAVIKSGVIVFLVVFLLLSVWEVMVALLRNTIDSMDYFKINGVSILETVKSSIDAAEIDKKWELQLLDIKYALKSVNSSKIYIEMLTDTEEMQLLGTYIKDKLATDGLDCKVGVVNKLDADKLTSMHQQENIIFIVEKGKATYDSVDKALGYARRYKLNVIGAVEWIFV